MSTKNIMAEEREVNMAQQMLSRFLPYWPLYVLLAIITLAGTYAYLRYVTPMYEATATLIIKDETRGGGGGEDSRLIETLNLISSKKSIENEIEVLQSRSLMEKVVKALYLYAPVSETGKIKSGDAYTLSPIMIEAQNPDSIMEVEKVNFRYDKNEQTVILNNVDKYPINQFVSTPYGVLKFMPNRYHFTSPNSNRNQFFFSLNSVQNTAYGLLMGLKITPNKQSAILVLTFKDAIPLRAVDIINQLITTYDRVSILEKNTLARNTLAFVDEQLASVTHDLDSIEKKVQLYRSGSNVVDISAQSSIYLKNVSENDQKLGDVNIQLSMLDLVEKNVANKQFGEILAPSTSGVADPTLTNLLNQLQTSQAEYDKLKKTVGANNPTLLSLGDQISKLQPSILENIRNQKQGLAASKQSLNQTNNSYNGLLSSVPKKEQQLVEISRQHQNKSSLYQTLLQNKAQAEMTLAQVVSNSRVVDKALAGKFPVSPKKKMFYMMALVGSLAFGIGIIIIKDTITGKIKFRSEIEKMTSIPIIGEIAFEKTKSPLVIEKGTRSFVAEEYRKLRISLSFLGIDATHKKLLITSSISGEGKSFVAANLAVSISLTGKKVVLVDLDLNRPTQSEILNVNYENGVTQFLTGEKDVAEIIHKLDSHESLYFISAGSIPDNPTELLANGKIASLLEYLGNNFDMVVIDTSPAALVTDAYILSGLCDATLYVVRHDYTPKLLVNRLDETNQVNPINNPAIIFNGLKTRGIFKSKYGYGNNYVYGDKYYGYGGAKIKKEKKSA